jgi:hypothetical protein
MSQQFPSSIHAIFMVMHTTEDGPSSNTTTSTSGSIHAQEEAIFFLASQGRMEVDAQCDIRLTTRLCLSSTHPTLRDILNHHRLISLSLSSL